MPYSIKTFYLVVLACFFGNESCFCAFLSRKPNSRSHFCNRLLLIMNYALNLIFIPTLDLDVFETHGAEGIDKG